MSFLVQLPGPIKNWLATAYGMYNYFKKTKGRKRLLKELESRKDYLRKNWKEYQSTQLQEILSIARFHVPYYKRFWNNSNLDWRLLENWPVMNKEIIKGNEGEFIDERLSKKALRKMYTSGSSGQPMCFYLSDDAFGLWYMLYDERIKKHHGVNVENDSFATFAGRIFLKRNRTKPPFWMWNAWDKQLYCSTYHLADKNLKYYVKALESRNIRYIMGYVSAITIIANYIVKNNIKHRLKLKVVITNAEPLYNHQREIIESAFGCKVVETYSGCEYAFGGNQMFDGKMILWPEAGILEILNDRGELQDFGSGEFVATGLINDAMPLIRYRIGDIGEIAEATYRGFQYLKNIEGRADDIIISENGTPIGRMDPVFKKDYDIKEAQIVQEEERVIVVNLVRGPRFTDETEKDLREGINFRVGKGVEVRFNYLEGIPRSSNGKFKAVISKI